MSETRIAAAEAAIEELRQANKVIFGKLDAIASALSDMRAASGPSWRDMLSVIRDGAVLFSLIVGGILYLANATSTRGNDDLKDRLTRLETIVGMVAKRTSGAL